MCTLHAINEKKSSARGVGQDINLSFRKICKRIGECERD